MRSNSFIPNQNKIIVVGATGQIGSRLYASAQNFGTVVGTSSQGKNQFLRLDLGDLSSIDVIDIKHGDFVFLTAAISAPDVCAEQYDHAYSINVDRTFKFVRQALSRGARVIFFSSDAVYGEQKNAIDDFATANPIGEYAKMKNEIEKSFLGNDQFKSIRISYVFSKDDTFTRYLVRCLKTSETAFIYHPFYRSIVYVDDVVQGALSMAVNWHLVSHQFVNFGGPEILSRVDFVNRIKNDYMPNLKYEIVTPDGSFFDRRPRVIAMESPILSKLLGRETTKLSEALRLKFSPGSDSCFS